MEMEMEMQEELFAVEAHAGDLAASLLDRLTAAACALEEAAARLEAVPLEAAASGRETELARLLADAETTIATLKAGRKTAPAGVTTLLAKEGPTVELGSLDAALGSLSLEQRIAVKAGLMRSGLIG